MAMFILTAQSGIGGDASTYAQFPPGTKATYPNTDCEFIYGKHDAHATLAAPAGSAVGKLTETTLMSGSFYTPSVNVAKVYTAQLNRSSSLYGGLMAVQNFSGSASSLRYGWFMYKGELRNLNQQLVRDGGTAINARVTNVGANALIRFGADAKFRSVASATIYASFARARVAASGSACANILLFGQIT